MLLAVAPSPNEPKNVRSSVLEEGVLIGSENRSRRVLQPTCIEELTLSDAERVAGGVMVAEAVGAGVTVTV